MHILAHLIFPLKSFPPALCHLSCFCLDPFQFILAWRQPDGSVWGGLSRICHQEGPPTPCHLPGGLGKPMGSPGGPWCLPTPKLCITDCTQWSANKSAANCTGCYFGLIFLLLQNTTIPVLTLLPVYSAHVFFSLATFLFPFFHRVSVLQCMIHRIHFSAFLQFVSPSVFLDNIVRLLSALP